MRLGITQRVDVVAAYGERRDCLDQQWQVLFDQLGHQLIPVPNRLKAPEAWAEKLALEGLVLTGGNDLADLPGAAKPAPERDYTETQLLVWAERTGYPVLGVCRGLQLINIWQGGTLTRVDGHVACRHALTACGDELPGLEGRSEVNSFHAWGVPGDGLGQDLLALARVQDGFVEALRHRIRPWLGIMWHPERESPFSPQDLELLAGLFGDSE